MCLSWSARLTKTTKTGWIYLNPILMRCTGQSTTSMKQSLTISLLIKALAPTMLWVYRGDSTTTHQSMILKPLLNNLEGEGAEDKEECKMLKIYTKVPLESKECTSVLIETVLLLRTNQSIEIKEISSQGLLLRPDLDLMSKTLLKSIIMMVWAPFLGHLS